MVKKSKKKINKKANKLYGKHSSHITSYIKDWNEIYNQALNRNSAVWSNLVAIKPETEKQKLARLKKEKARQKAEEKRRAKKITMTVGELEDKLDEARRDYEW